MKSKYLWLFSCGIAVIAGCINVSTGTISQQPTALQTARVQLQPIVVSGGFVTQAIVNPYVASDIQHLIVKVFKINNGTETSVNDAAGAQLFRDVPSTSLGEPVVFDHLTISTTYRFRAYAFSTLDTSNPISADASSSVDLMVTNDDRPPQANLRVQLIDKVFNGQATASNIVVSSGSIVHTGHESVH